MSLEKEIKEYLAESDNFGKQLWEDLRYFRTRKRGKHARKKMEQVKRPVAVFNKEDRLLNGEGIELTLIFRSKACSWARSKSGGCTMCGYWNDRAIESITDKDMLDQFLEAIEKKKALLEENNNDIAFKMFTSGSFCDSKELSLEYQKKILATLNQYESVKEIVVESRPEYITEQVLEAYKDVLKSSEKTGKGNRKHLEFAIGLESSSEFMRKNFINKGFSWDGFQSAVDRIHSHGFGVKVYLLFKPPFVSEYAALCDLKRSLRDCLNLGVETISINPTNIQNHTICSQLERFNMFRPPWCYSLLRVLKSTLQQEDLKNTRVVSDPSGAGKSRGIHNCVPRDRSTNFCLKVLEKFVMTQDLSVIPEDLTKDACWDEYLYEILL